MKVSELGQFGLIDKITRLLERARDPQARAWRDLVVGAGDDCAVWQAGKELVLGKVDSQVQGVHFKLDWMPWEDLGWKALAVNLSDIAAMGGVPRYALVSLGLPPETEVEDVISLYKGMLKLAKKTGTAVAGGHVSGSPNVFVDVSVIGAAGNPAGRYLTRSSAQPGDRIAVTGWLGSAAAGLAVLKGEAKPATAAAKRFKQAFCHPEPRLEEGRLLIAKGVKAAIDISDGLLADLGHICRASGVGAVVDIERLPILPEVKAAFGLQAYTLALSGGEDYQLLFTAGTAALERVRRASKYPVTVIGEITAENAGRVVAVDAEGKRLRTPRAGWDHFKGR